MTNFLLVSESLSYCWYGFLEPWITYSTMIMLFWGLFFVCILMFIQKNSGNKHQKNSSEHMKSFPLQSIHYFFNLHC